jgi:two-component system sensor histidine kinase PrrB
VSIRARVTVAATAAVVLVLVAVGLSTVATFARHERSNLDHELEQRAQGPAARAAVLPFPLERRGGLPGGREGPAGLLAESGSFVRVIRGGEVAAEAGDVPANGFPLPRTRGLDTITSQGHKWRVLTVSQPAPPGTPGEAGDTQVEFAADLEPTEDRIGELRRRVLLICGLGVLLAAVLASLLSGLALGPLSRLRGAVTGISGTRDLSRRLPDSGAAEEVNDLARSVNAMLARLEHSSAETEGALEATRRFAADVGHEVRTPLTSIRANLDSLRRNPEMAAPQRQAILEEVAKEQRDLVSLLDSLQALARGDAAAAIPREQLDLAEVVGAAVESARRRHPEAAIDLAVPDGGHELEGWPDGLRLLAENLIENAVRHGGGHVTVALEGERPGGPLRLSVDDDGPGVPAAERELIFERFARGTAAKAPGSGLGLALVAQQAALHGGSVAVAESRARGARFTVTLP